MFAAAGGHKEVAELLIYQKADINAKVKATADYKEQVCTIYKAIYRILEVDDSSFP